MVNWVCKEFSQLTTDELHSILRLRNEVFVVEQNCPYQDLDGKDHDSRHFTGWENGKLVAYTRILPPGLAYPQMSIGRVVTSPAARRKGLGKELMVRTIQQCYDLFGKNPIRIGAQKYLLQFYLSLGFEISSDTYLEDGIEHVEMIKPIPVS